MRILLDESLPRKLRLELPGHDVRTVQQIGWAGIRNGELLSQAAGQFDVQITGDQNLEFQQNLTQLQIAVVVLVAINNRIETLRPLVPELLQILDRIKLGHFVSLGDRSI